MVAIFLLSLFGFLLVGVPVGFSLALTAILLMIVKGTLATSTIAQYFMYGVDNFPLMAIPFFMLAGEIMTVGGISQRIVNFAKALMGHIKGGLGYVSVLACMIFAGVSGTAVADTSAIGSIMLPVMEREGYDRGKSTALICAAGCIGPIIPPSFPMILYGVIAGVSVTKLFLGGIVPGVVIGLALMAHWYFIARKSNYPITERASFRELLIATKDAFWALIMPLIILGGIISGVFTPTEAGVIAVVYAFVVSGLVYRELKLKDLPKVLTEAAIGTAIVIFVCGAATVAGYYITVARIPHLLGEMVKALASTQFGVLVIINILLLLVGMVMDLTPALLILGPILVPLAKSFGVDPVYLGVIMTVNLAIGLLTPPVGSVLYVGCRLGRLSMVELSKHLYPFIFTMVVVLFIILFIPKAVMWIPSLISR